MDRPTRLVIVPAVLLLCGLAGCVVETPAQRDVVVEHPAPQTVYAAPAPVYATPPGTVVVRP
jgi:hypothetical protein